MVYTCTHRSTHTACNTVIYSPLKTSCCMISWIHYHLIAYNYYSCIRRQGYERPCRWRNERAICGFPLIGEDHYLFVSCSVHCWVSPWLTSKPCNYNCTCCGKLPKYTSLCHNNYARLVMQVWALAELYSQGRHHDLNIICLISCCMTLSMVIHKWITCLHDYSVTKSNSSYVSM